MDALLFYMHIVTLQIAEFAYIRRVSDWGLHSCMCLNNQLIQLLPADIIQLLE